ncbi:tRNA dihydrouridine synthase DusB [Anaeromyxobacter paludicola]|uniref:tRNA-dihydrouridine synthase n=1 Tax=Anaeromyxobacter paludicola TaxID=2918171 RepID=A0ABM7XEJ2_9BACT|nr:tRNA dihydrouridine synthase DusB [Anaeromyxobacter paludicola]BDG10281.1 tRNA-dihydrouridine synthase [Anaeromyxobacter paludicola]
MHIGPHQFSGSFFLAPLAGVSDRPFRLLCREMGAAFAYTEMVSAHGLLHGSLQTESYLDRDPSEVPFAVQIFASEPEVLARAGAEAVKRGADLVDINMACPVKKVCGTGAGAAMARDPARVEAAVRAVAAATGGVPVSVKIRAGWDANEVNCVDVARAAEAGGAAAVALHGRTRAQGYSGRADWTRLAAVKRAVGIPVLGSGDVFTAQDALRMKRETGVDFVLVARGACGNPWIFRELRCAEEGRAAPPLTRDEWVSTILRHVRMQIDHRRAQRPRERPEVAEDHAVRELRRHLLWYTRGRRGGVAFRRDAVSVNTLAGVEALVERHFPPGSPAFELDPSIAPTPVDEP